MGDLSQHLRRFPQFLVTAPLSIACQLRFYYCQNIRKKREMRESVLVLNFTKYMIYHELLYIMLVVFLHNKQTLFNSIPWLDLEAGMRFWNWLQTSE